ncbi:MAG TPA: glycosyl hydrolase 53 family protein [Verrucomicrobiae bacterium]|nr:glycosyl hydrolase 53 family protein [Verrucomicrobiae bacterium]
MCTFFPAWLRRSGVVGSFTHRSPAANKYDNPVPSGKMKISTTVLSWNRVQSGVGILAAIILFPTAGCAGGPAPQAVARVNPVPFYLGADISTLAEVEQRGGIYMDGDKPGDALAIFMKHGWTCFRLRIWVDPRDGVNGLEYTTKLAKRIKDAGGTFMLDFHYSDWWADPQKQNKPAAWAHLDFDALVRKTETYTAHVIKTLKDAGATPDFVQIGNEITGGMLWPDGQVKVPLSTVKVFGGDVTVIKPPEPYDDARQWDHLIRLLKADARGVRSVTTPEDHVRIVIHIDCGGDWPVTKWYFDHLTRAGVDYDVIGQSYYPNWHGTLEDVRDNLRHTIERYHKDVMIVETAYPSRDVHPSPAAAKNMIWPMTPEGQKQFLVDLIRVVRQAPGGRGIGVNYWHPEATFIPGSTNRWSGPDANSLFDAKGNPLPAMYVLGPQPAVQTAHAEKIERH